MSIKAKVTLWGVSILVAFAAGRYTLPTKVVTETKENKASDTEKDKHKETTVTEEVETDGSKKTVTTVVEDDKTDKKSTDVTDTKTETTRNISQYHLEVIGGYTLGKPTPVYGGILSKEFIGPITLGVFGTSQMTFGLSIGLMF